MSARSEDFCLDRLERAQSAVIIHVPSARSEEKILGLRRNPTATQLISEGSAQDLDIDEHALDLSQLARRFNTDVDGSSPDKSSGLRSDAATARLAKDGPNTLPPPPKTSPVKLFLEALVDPLNLLLLIAAVISLGLYATDTAVYTPIYLGCLLLIVTFGNASIDFVQARASNRYARAFHRAHLSGDRGRV